MSRLFKVWFLVVGLLACGAVLAQQVPSLPFSPSSGGGGLSASSLGSLACLLTGGTDCTMTGSVLGVRQTGPGAVPLALAGAGDENTGLAFEGWNLGADFLSVIVNGTRAAYFSGTEFVGGTGTGGRMRLGASTLALPQFVTVGDTGTGFGVEAGLAGITTAGSYDIFYHPAGYAYSVSTYQGPDGTVSAPALTFTGDTDSGIYRNASGSIAFANDGVRGLVVGGGTAATLHYLDGKNDTAGSGGVVRSLWIPPRSVGTTIVAAPTCDASILGARLFLDDTDDSKLGVECLCSLSNDNTTHQWLYRRATSLVDGWEGTGCVIP